MAVTLKKISEKTGINIGSVSHVLNNHPKAMELKEETRNMILRVARELNYHRNAMARSIVTGAADIIAFVAADMGIVEYTGRIQAAIFQTTGRHGYAVSYYRLEEGNEEAIIRNILEWNYSGIILHVLEGQGAKILEIAEKHKIPVGIVNHSNVPGTFGATSDDFAGALEVVKYLSGLGHRRIALVTHPSLHEEEFLRNRREGYLQGMRQFVPNIEPQIHLVESRNEPGDCPDLKKLLDAPATGLPTAFFCVMDTLAIELCRAAYHLEKKVPADFSVVGFGDLDLARHSVIPLTTVAQPFEEMSRLVAENIIDAAKKKKRGTGEKNRQIATVLVVRESTAPPPDPA